MRACPNLPLLFIGCAFCWMSIAAHAAPQTPVIFDTDIGTDIDDAYALAALLQHPELELVGVTTVSGDAVARARLAAKLLHVAGPQWRQVPVYAGTSSPPQYMRQVDWAAGFTAANLHESGGVDFMRREIEARPGRLTLIAVGELTNVASLLESTPQIAPKIRAIALMGGSVFRGYAPGSKPEPEWNIKSNASAARVVFDSGVPLRIAPLDSTADLRLTPDMRVALSARGTALHDALAALNSIWRHTNTWNAENPTLFDVLAVELATANPPYPLRKLHLRVDDHGLTVPDEDQAPNAEVALDVDADQFMRSFVNLLNR
jgi:purine nucleosidase